MAHEAWVFLNLWWAFVCLFAQACYVTSSMHGHLLCVLQQAIPTWHKQQGNLPPQGPTDNGIPCP